MRLSELIRYYSRKDVIQELIRVGQNKEVAIQYKEGFGKRPDILQMPGDIISAVRSGATSFHVSEERWDDPMKLKEAKNKKDLDQIRTGFDLVLDIDCKFFEWSKITADLIMNAMKYHDVNCASVKFSGGSGFHIGVPYEALEFKKKLDFPHTPRIIAEYLKEFIRPHLSRRILEHEHDIKNIIKKVGKKSEELFDENKQFDPYLLVDIDTILLSSRHLFRMPYSLHERKGWLVSLPVNAKNIMDFDLDWAKPENITEIRDDFLNREKAKRGEASQLLVQALDWKIRQTESETKKEFKEFNFEGKVPVEAFPPCIKLILEGLEDGRKRALFALLNFLKTISWNWKDIEDLVKEWNKKNPEPLSPSYVTGQLKWHQRSKDKFPPPNCNAINYYVDIGVCKPDFVCKRIKNPVSYSRIKIHKKKRWVKK